MVPKSTFKLKFDGHKSGLCYNPNNQRKTFKIIFPGEFTAKHEKVELWTKEGELFETLYRAVPNEYGNRMRFYGKKPVKKYPKGIKVFLFLKSGEVGVVTVKDPSKRQD